MVKTSKHRSDLAQDFTVITSDGGVILIGDQRSDVTVFARESFHCCFMIDNGGDDVALFTILLTTGDDVDTVADFGIDHGMIDVFEHEEFALNDGFGKVEDLRGVLFGKGR